MLMLVWRVVTVVELLVFALLVAFILLRPADATGVDNSLTMQLISLGLIAFFIFAISHRSSYLVHYPKNKKVVYLSLMVKRELLLYIKKVNDYHYDIIN